MRDQSNYTTRPYSGT